MGCGTYCAQAGAFTSAASPTRTPTRGPTREGSRRPSFAHSSRATAGGSITLRRCGGSVPLLGQLHAAVRGPWLGGALPRPSPRARPRDGFSVDQTQASPAEVDVADGTATRRPQDPCRVHSCARVRDAVRDATRLKPGRREPDCTDGVRMVTVITAPCCMRRMRALRRERCACLGGQCALRGAGVAEGLSALSTGGVCIAVGSVASHNA
mmetsp:Transcript_5969/g.15550  ORF Transcript_5969/g.15550 Transcript_5969/m.15550 type:complete len:210 (-) Transcript_5969:246-875(-)